MTISSILTWSTRFNIAGWTKPPLISRTQPCQHSQSHPHLTGSATTAHAACTSSIRHHEKHAGRIQGVDAILLCHRSGQQQPSVRLSPVRFSGGKQCSVLHASCIRWLPQRNIRTANVPRHSDRISCRLTGNQGLHNNPSALVNCAESSKRGEHATAKATTEESEAASLSHDGGSSPAPLQDGWKPPQDLCQPSDQDFEACCEVGTHHAAKAEEHSSWAVQPLQKSQRILRGLVETYYTIVFYNTGAPWEYMCSLSMELSSVVMEW